MRATVDEAGRFVIPKRLRAARGVEGCSEVELTERDGELVLSIAPTPMHLEEQDGLPVAVADAGELPTLTADEVRAAVERTRR